MRRDQISLVVRFNKYVITYQFIFNILILKYFESLNNNVIIIWKRAMGGFHSPTVN